MEFFNKTNGIIVIFNQEDDVIQKGKKIKVIPAHKFISEALF